MTCLGLGDRDRAKFHFEKAVNTRMYHYFDADYGWSQTFLKKLNANPNWPRWIPHVAPMPKAKP
jgi:hypothetical protein